MRRRLLLTYVSLAAIVLLILEVPLGVTQARRERDAAASGGLRDATTLAALSEEGLDSPGSRDLASLIANYRIRTGSDAAVLDAGGKTVVGFNNLDLDEAGPALRAGLTVTARGASATGSVLDESGNHGYAAVPIRSTTGVRGTVVVVYPMGAVERRVHRFWLGLIVLAAVVLAAAAGVGELLSGSVARPLGRLRSAVDLLGGGDLAARADPGRGPAEVRALAEAFNDMAARLEELIGAQRRFVADASHQLRTPLTALRLRLENLDLGGTGGDDVDAAMREVLRLSRLVDGLLALARAEGARRERSEIDIAGVVEERRLAWAPLAEERGVQLRVDIGPGDLAAMAVPGDVEQIIDNFLANALDASPPGRSVVLRAGRVGGAVEVHVVDHGPGMSEQDRARAFDRFWRGSGAGAGGTGLGLAIVAQLATASGARVELRQTDGTGVDAAVLLHPA